MAVFSRTDRSIVSRWWWTVDRWALVAIGVLLAIGLLMSLAASPAVAEGKDYLPFHFVYRQALFALPAIIVILTVSALEPDAILKLSAACFGFFWVAMAATLVFGDEIKGATRWLAVGPFTLQPSEFVKPALIVVIAACLTRPLGGRMLWGLAGAAVLYLATIGVLLQQPDFGQSALITLSVIGLLFVWGIPVSLMAVIGVGMGIASFAAYALLPHVTSRVDRFLDPDAGDSHQVMVALRSFANGGLTGAGPGEGRAKLHLPDAHADYIFAVAGEEFGLIACLILIALFAIFVLRGLLRSASEPDRFVQLASFGLVVVFGLQAVINIAVSLALVPSKGMTLPFVSYGGSSLVGLALTVGMILALTRHRPAAGRRR